MNGIKMKDCRFYVDEAARTVVCVIPHTRDMVINFILEHFQFTDMNMYDGIDSWHGTFAKNLRMPKSFTGKAICAPEDDWNEETGRMVAFAKAKDKCYKSFFKRANLFVQTIDGRLGDMITMFNDFGLKLEAKRTALQDQIDERTGVEKE